MTEEAQSLKSSPEYQAAESLAQQRIKAEAQREDLRNSMLELFSHASRAFTKYSYGVSKETEARLNLMSSEPWKLLDMSDISGYLSLLSEVRKSITSGKIQLKDSDKTIHYFDLITESLPDLQTRARQIREELSSLSSQDSSAVDKVKMLEQRIAETTGHVSRTRDSIEMSRRQNQERRTEVDALLAEASELLSSIAGQRYSVHS
jgi:hypothetical protein